MIPDAHITEARLRAVRGLPWPIPALVILMMTDEDLDRLSAASQADYWRVLNGIITRIESRAGPPSFGG